MPIQRDVYDTNDLMKDFGWGVIRVREWIDSGRLRAKSDGRRRLFTREAVLRLIESLPDVESRSGPKPAAENGAANQGPE